MTPTYESIADSDLELGLLSAMFADPTQVPEVARIVTSADFHVPAHAMMFEAVVTVDDAGKFVRDMRVTIPHLRAIGISDAQWSAYEIGKLIAAGGIGSNARLYAERVRRLSLLRAQADVAEEFRQKTHQPDADPRENLVWLDSQLSSFSETGSRKTQSITDATIKILDDIDRPDNAPVVMIGLQVVDSIVGGFSAGDLPVLAARPGVGKTSFAMQTALHNAKKGRRTLFVTLEMSGEDITKRAMCGLAGVDTRRVRAKTLTNDDRQRLVKAAAQLHGLPITFWAPPSATAGQIRACARMEAKVAPISLLIVDYVQIVKATDPRAPREQQVADSVRQLKALARELQVPLLCLAQLNREVEKGQVNSKPKLSHLRESGAIEAEADSVMFLHDAPPNEDGDTNSRSRPVSLIIAKHRNGEVGEVPMFFLPAETRFEDCSEPAFAAYNNTQ